MTRIKICGLARPEDVELAVELGAHAVGFVLEPTSPRCIPPDRAEELAKIARPYCSTVAVYGRARGPLPCLHAYQAVEFETAHHGSHIQTVRVRKESTLEEVLAAAEGADALLLDAYSSSEYGGTGKRIDWSFAARVVEECSIPVILAGGLMPENVQRAIAIVNPYAVDVSSGVESAPGVKDHGRLREFFEAAATPL